MKPHKHAALIKAWADGKTVQYRSLIDNEWCDLSTHRPLWDVDYQYRIKPEQKPDVVRYACSKPDTLIACNKIWREHDNLLLTWCGETGKLKEAKVI